MNIVSDNTQASQIETAPGTDLLHVGMSTAFINKELRPGYTKEAYGDSFIPTALPLAEFVQHVLDGGAFTLAYFKNKSRIKANFVLAELLGLDFDNGVSVAQASADPFIGQYAFLIYPTPSSTLEHPKTRVLFRLSEPVYEAERWEALQRGLIAHYAHWQPDPSCKDSARLFFGSDREGGIQL